MSQDKPTVIHLIQSLGVGGCETALLRTLPYLPAFNHFILTLKKPGQLAGQFEKINVPVIQLKHSVELISFAKNKKAKLVITYMFHADFFGRIFQFFLNCPVVPYLRTTYNYPKYFPARIFEKVTSPFVRTYLANSPAVKTFYVQKLGVAKEKIRVIPNGIDLNQFRRSAKASNQMRRSLHIAREDFVILCMANFHPNKGHQFLIDAFGKLTADNVWLLLAGDGQTKTAMEKLAISSPKSDRIKFLGQRNDFSSLLSASDIFVLPTFFEGLSNALIGALAAGVAAVATDIPENRVLIVPNQTGLLFPVADTSALASQLNLLLSGSVLRSRLAASAKKKIADEYNIVTTSKELTKTLRELIDQP
ncbi:hypothetical protein A2397_05090 [Candidatus Amesbacteria bacterium RIFOXYB1_FULL_44_23]|uniref:Glycosyltransferase subfamily 4-like N-terminal domain-containing protein n=1 Tax=Candidatus Amesbacteria bacterium RIFOXYB1_FULL_44_23 TaxID=1797263 RepID=A0A1F4ZRD4_9BACT|nr:MAG: hypothetical protein A2397_05090 [Candidatus Amesbacteria bacterium RIFOXYB1_FULL_44_23]